MHDKNCHHYKAFGLKIQSEIACPNLPTSEGEPDVVIHYGDVPDQSDPERGFLLNVKGVGRYFIEAGCRITISAEENTKDEDIRLFLMGSAIGALLHQRGFLVLHGCAVQLSQGVLAIVADSGTGKSTLARAFYQRGFSIYSDDVCVIDVENNLLVYPGYEQIKLWQSSMDHYGLDNNECDRVVNRFDKYVVPISQTALTPKPLFAVCEYSVSDRLSLHKAQGFKKVETLLRHTYRNQYLASMQKLPQHLALCETVSNQISVARLTRPESGAFSVEKIVDMLLSQFEPAYVAG